MNSVKRQAMLSKLKNVSGYQPRKERIKQGQNFEVNVDDNGCLDATSYRWWHFFVEKNGLYFFNWYSYSSSTRKHQYSMSNIVRTLGIDYITVSYSKSLRDYSLERILSDKINSLYQGENAQSLRRQGCYAVYTEESFNETMKDIRKIAEALKMPETKLNKMLIEAELKASNDLVELLVAAHEKRVSRRNAQKLNENLAAIEL